MFIMSLFILNNSLKLNSIEKSRSFIVIGEENSEAFQRFFKIMESFINFLVLILLNKMALLKGNIDI